MEEWRKNSWDFQQEVFRRVGNREWDDVNCKEKIIRKKLDIGFEMCYGEDFDNNENIKYRTDKVRVEVKKLFEDWSVKYFYYTFLNIRMKTAKGEEGLYCVFWLKNDDKEVCLDLHGRNYSSWEDFLDNNVLPKCSIIYPKYGKYCNKRDIKEDCLEVAFEDSHACSTRRLVKNVADVGTSIGTIAGTGILAFNPVGASMLMGATVATVASGFYNVCNSISKLVDIHKHDGGLSITDGKTLLTVGELVISAAGTTAVGAAARYRRFTATGAILIEGSVAYRLANNLSNITKVFSGINAGFYTVVMIDKYIREGKLETMDVLYLGKVIFFSFNVIASEEVLNSMISFMAKNFSLNQMIQLCNERIAECVTLVAGLCTFIYKDDVKKLIEKIFPNYEGLTEKISNIGNIIIRTASIVDRTALEIQECDYSKQKFDGKFFSFLLKELNNLWNDILHYKRSSRIAIQQEFGEKMSETVKKWTMFDGIDLLSDDSKYEEKMNMPIKMKNTVAKTIEICSKHIVSKKLLKLRENHLYSELFELVNLHGWEDKSPTYIYSKINFYCNKFLDLYRKTAEKYHYEYFISNTVLKETKSKHDFFLDKHDIFSIHEFVYDLAFECLVDNVQKYHDEFENKYDSDCDSSKDSQKTNVVFEIEMSCNTDSLMKDDYYKKGKELLPQLEMKLNEVCATFQCKNGVAIIKSEQDDFMMLFYFPDVKAAKGILLYVEDIKI